MDQSTINTIFAILIALIFVILICVYRNNHEDMTNISNEAVQNLSSLYNQQSMTLTNLHVTGTLTVDGAATINSVNTPTLTAAAATTTNLNTTNLAASTNITSPTANIGSWNIRGSAMGIKGVADINMGSDGWVRNVTYGNNNTDNSSYTPNVGFAGADMYSSKLSNMLSTAINNAQNTANDAIPNNAKIGILSPRNGYLQDNGGWASAAPNGAGDWQCLSIIRSGC